MVSIATQTDFIVHWSLTISPQPQPVYVYSIMYSICAFDRIVFLLACFLPPSLFGAIRDCAFSRKVFLLTAFLSPSAFGTTKNWYNLLCHPWMTVGINIMEAWGIFFILWVSSAPSYLRLIWTIIITSMDDCQLHGNLDR